MRRRAIDRLALEIAELDRQRRERLSHVDEDRVTEAERAFCVLADSKGKRVFRNGWPDFLVYDPESGAVVYVEVKAGEDDIRPAQRTMFTVLEAMQLQVVIWSPENPHRLVPWRRWDAARRAPRGERPRGPRLPASGRVDTLDAKRRRS